MKGIRNQKPSIDDLNLLSTRTSFLSPPLSLSLSPSPPPKPQLLDARERLLSLSPLGPAGDALSLSSIDGGGGGGAGGEDAGALLVLRAWRAADGALLWDRAPGPCGPSAAASGASGDGSVAVVACAATAEGGRPQATAFDGASGLRKWSVALPASPDGGPPASLAVAPSGGSPSAVGVAWASASELGAVSLSAADGRVLPSAGDGSGGAGGGSRVPSAARPLSPASLVLAGTAAAALSLDGKRVCFSDATGGSARCVSLPAAAGDCSSGRLSASGAVVVASCSAGAVAVALGGGSSGALPSVLELLDGAAAGAAGAAGEREVAAYAGVSRRSEAGTAGAVDVSSPLFPACSAPPSRSASSSASSSPLTPERAWLGRVSSSSSLSSSSSSASSSSSPPSPAVLVAARDGTLSLTVAASGGEKEKQGDKEEASTRRGPLWVRHEALARSAAASGAVAPLFAPLPPPADAKEAPSSSSSSSPSSKMPLSSLLRLEWLAVRASLPGSFAGLSPLEAAELRALRAEQARRGAASADARGFRQAALLLSDSGTLFALHTGDGAVLWRADGVAEAAGGGGEEGEGKSRRAVVHWRSSHSHSHSPPPLSPSSSSSFSSTAPLVAVFSGDRFSVVDAFSGLIVETGKLPFAPLKVVELPGAGATRERPDAAFLLVGEESPAASDSDAAADDGVGPPVALFPATQATLEAAEALEAQGPLRFWLRDDGAGTLTGFAVSKGAEGDQGGERGPLARRLARSAAVSWRHAFGGPGSLLSVAAPSARDAAPAAAARVLGDRSMKLRLAPGALLFVASADGGGGGDGDEDEGSPRASSSGGITASILDAVSGQFVFRQAHARGRGPVLAAWAENAVYYHFASDESSPSSSTAGEGRELSGLAADGTAAPTPPRWLVGSMELYDLARGEGLSAGALALGAVRGLLPKGKATRAPPSPAPSSPSEQSSFDPPPAEVLRATFSVPHPASSLSTTVSSRGVAARWLLLGDARSGDLLALDRRWLDPRRPAGGAAAAGSAEALEGLPPYHPDLPVVQGMSPTHGARLRGLSGVAAQPAALESTCLLLVAGSGKGGGRGRRGSAGDLFGTRAQPASSFDALPADFPFGLLLAATAATLAGAAALRVAADREALRQQWA